MFSLVKLNSLIGTTFASLKQTNSKGKKMIINEECISCSACIDECPQNAIYAAGSEYELNGEMKSPISEEHPFVVPELCDNCKSCTEVCPTDSIVE